MQLFVVEKRFDLIDDELYQTHTPTFRPNRLLFRTYSAHCQRQSLTEVAVGSAAHDAGGDDSGYYQPQATKDWGTFVDVGSGSGIGVFTAFLALPFSVCAVSLQLLRLVDYT